MGVYTLAQLRTKVLGRLDDNANLHSTDEIDFVTNEAVRVAALFTGFYRATATANTVAGQLEYAVPTPVLFARSVSLAGRQLQKISLKKLARLRRGWATDTTATAGPTQFWAPVGMGTFIISPREAAADRVLSVSGLAEPPLLTAQNLLALENEYVEMVTEYDLHRLPLKEGGKIFADGSLALNDFYSLMNQRKAYEQLKMPKYWLLEGRQEKAE